MIEPKGTFGLQFAEYKNYLYCLFVIFTLAAFTIFLKNNIHAFSFESLRYANVFLYTFIFIFNARRNGLLSFYSIFLIFLFVFIFSRYFIGLFDNYHIDSYCHLNSNIDTYRITSIINFSFLLSSFIPSLFFKAEYKLKLKNHFELENITKQLIFLLLPFHFFFLSVYAYQILTNDISLVYLNSEELIFKMNGLSPLNLSFKLLSLLLMGYFCSLPKRIDKKIVILSSLAYFIFFIIGFKKIFVGYLFFLLWYLSIIKKIDKRYIILLLILIPLVIFSNSIRYFNLFGFSIFSFDIFKFLFQNSQTYCVFNYYFFFEIDNQPIIPILSPITDRVTSLASAFGYDVDLKFNLSNFISKTLNPNHPANGTGTAFFIEVYDFFGLVMGSSFIFILFHLFHLFQRAVYSKRFYLFFSFLFIPFIVMLPRGYVLSILIPFIFMLFFYKVILGFFNHNVHDKKNK